MVSVFLGKEIPASYILARMMLNALPRLLASVYLAYLLWLTLA